MNIPTLCKIRSFKRLLLALLTLDFLFILTLFKSHKKFHLVD